MTAEKPVVCVSYLFPSDVSGWFASSLANMLLYDAYSGDNYIRPPEGGVISFSSSPRIAEARNRIVDLFATEFTDADWLLMIDSDMTFSANLLHELMAVADPEEHPVVGGLAFSGRAGNKPYPTIYRQIEKRTKDDEPYLSIDRVYDYPRNALVKVGATGGACLLMHRSILAKMKQVYETNPDGSPNCYPWFQDGVIGPEGEPWGEDIMFGLRVNQLGASVWVHTGVKLGHVKTQIIDEEYYDNYRRSEELTAQGAYDKPRNRAERRRAARSHQKV